MQKLQICFNETIQSSLKQLQMIITLINYNLQSIIQDDNIESLLGLQNIAYQIANPISIKEHLLEMENILQQCGFQKTVEILENCLNQLQDSKHIKKSGPLLIGNIYSKKYEFSNQLCKGDFFFNNTFSFVDETALNQEIHIRQKCFGQITQIIYFINFENMIQISNNLQFLNEFPFEYLKKYIHVVIVDINKQQLKSIGQVMEDIKKQIHSNYYNVLFLNTEKNNEGKLNDIIKLQQLEQKTYYCYIENIDQFEKIKIFSTVLGFGIQLFQNNYYQQLKKTFNSELKKVQEKVQEFLNNDRIWSKMKIGEDYQLLIQLLVAIKNKTKKIIKQVEEDSKDIINQIYALQISQQNPYLIQILLQNIKITQLIELFDKVYEKIKSLKFTFLQEIKECPTCHIMWLRLYGADGQTPCGQYPEEEHLHCQGGEECNYEIDMNDEGITVKLINKRPLKFNFNKTFYQTQFKGCHHMFKWNSLPAISEDLQKELINPGLQDFFQSN